MYVEHRACLQLLNRRSLSLSLSLASRHQAITLKFHFTRMLPVERFFKMHGSNHLVYYWLRTCYWCRGSGTSLKPFTDTWVRKRGDTAAHTIVVQQTTLPIRNKFQPISVLFSETSPQCGDQKPLQDVHLEFSTHRTSLYSTPRLPFASAGNVNPKPGLLKTLKTALTSLFICS